MKKTYNIKLIISVLFLVLYGWQSGYCQLINGLEGDGTSSSPVLIKSTAELKTLSDYVNAQHTIQVRQKYFKLTNDLDFTNDSLAYDLDQDGIKESNFKPIGTYDNTGNSLFSGHFDGDNHTIKGLKINSIDFVGLFGAVTGTSLTNRTKIQNIKIIDSEFSGNNLIGGICGYHQYNTVSNCAVNALFTSYGSGCIVGGLVGYSYGNIIEGSRVRSIFKNTAPAASLGGVIGAAGKDGNITTTYSRSEFQSSEDSCYIGGIAGSSHTPFINCYSVSIFKNMNFNMGVIGGFIGGQVSGCNIKNSYCYTTVTTESAKVINVGGFVGQKVSGTITNCFYNDSSSLNNNNLATPLSEQDMKHADFVAQLNGQDSISIWSQDPDGRNDGYPILSSQTVGLNKITASHDVIIKNIDKKIIISAQEIQSIKVIDISGKLIYNNNLKSNDYSFEINAPQGVYIVSVKTSKTTTNSKIIIYN